MQWFRMYAEAVDDDKLRLLAFEDRWHFVALLCLKSGGILDSDPATLDRRIGIKLGLMPAELAEVKRRLREGLLIDDKWQPIAWGKRQFVSDNSTARVQKHRVKRSGNVPETTSKRFGNAPDTDTDTEQRKRRAKRASRAPPEFQPDIEYARQQLPDIDAPREVQKFRDWEFKTPRSDWPAVWRTWVENARTRGDYAKLVTTKNGPAMMFEGKPVEWR